MPGEDVGCDAWVSFPIHLGGMLKKSTWMRHLGVFHMHLGGLLMEVTQIGI